MDYDETLAALDSIEGMWAAVYPAEAGDEGPGDFTTRGLSVVGRFKRDPGSNEAYYTFEDMDDQRVTFLSIGGSETVPADYGGFVGLVLWRHGFIDAGWLTLPVRPAWLWIRSSAGGLVVCADFPDAPIL